jgi:hypothetical protein
MKVGDIVKIKGQGLSRWAADQYLDHIGIILSLEPDDEYEVAGVRIMINDETTNFLRRYIEVISEGR